MTSKAVVFLAALTLTVSAQTPAADERFYQAIRSDDLTTLRALVRSEGPNVRDTLGQTPLMLAAAFGSPEAVRLLLASGGDARATSGTGVTALHWAVTDAGKTRMLLDAGADVHAVTSLQRTPLILAASAHGTAETVRLLLARGADVHAADTGGVTALIAAANVNDTQVARLLLSRGADARAKAAVEGVATPLIGAARNGNLELVQMLLDRKADVNATTIDRGPTVKNGVIQFGSVTALHLGAVSGNPAVVKLLLEAGAAVDPLDIRGMTPLMFSIATDRPQPRIVRMLLDAGASTDVRSRANESAIDWARKFNNPAVLTELKLAPVSPPAHDATGSISETPRNGLTSRAAVERSLPLLRTASGAMLMNGGCVACHAQPLTGLAVSLARRQGWTPLSSEAESNQALTTLTAIAPDLTQLRDGGGRPDGLLYTSMLLAAEGTPASRATDALVRYVAAKQRKEGNWRGVGGTRAPMQDGDVSRTALAIRALSVYGAPARANEYAARVKLAAAWLASQTPISTEDRVMQILGLKWAGAGDQLRTSRAKELSALQRPDGGWAQTPHLASDAYATGQVLYTLREMGVPATDKALQRGAAFLRATQHSDGSWHVRNRAMKIQPYFDGSFPYGHDQWISHAGSAWAVMALSTVG